MKFVYLILAFTTVQSATSNTDPYTECMNQVEINEEELHNVTVETNTTLDSNTGKYFFCVWQKINIIDENGNVNREELKDFMEHEIQQVRPVTQFIRQYITAGILECDLNREEVYEQTAIKVKNCHTKIIVDVLVKL